MSSKAQTVYPLAGGAVPTLSERVNDSSIELRRLLASKRDVYREVFGKNINQLAVSVCIQQRNVLEFGGLKAGSGLVQRDSQLEMKSWLPVSTTILA